MSESKAKKTSRPAHRRHVDDTASGNRNERPRQQRAAHSSNEQTAATTPWQRLKAVPRRSDEQHLLQKPWAEQRREPKEYRHLDETSAPSKPRLSAEQLKVQEQTEAKVLGENAARVCFTERSDSIIKMYLQADVAPRFADVMKFLAKNKRAYHIVDSNELEKISASNHHGGIVLIVKKKQPLSLETYLRLHKRNSKDCLLALDGVGNPHNLGAIARTCAHFGASGIVMTEPELLQSGAAARTAEGGLEYVESLHCDSLTSALAACKAAGYTLITTSSHRGVSLYQSQLPAKVVIVFGEEMHGVSTQVANSAQIALQIPGTGKVESLNVSVAASLILGEWYRQQQ